MNAVRTSSPRTRSRRSGQTLVIAILTLGAVLIVGFVFLGLISNAVRTGGQAQRLSVAAQLAQAGTRYVHERLLESEEGADWRPALSDIATDGNFTRDPDALYLRPGTGFGWRADDDAQIDLGGPDGLGAYSRVDFPNGRALVRVRYAPDDPAMYMALGGGPRDLGRSRGYLVIESVGRPGSVNVNDPTSVPAGSVQFRGFGTPSEWREALGEMRRRDGQIVNTNKTIAYASIGIVEHARFITNKHDVSTPVELGFPRAAGAVYRGEDVSPPLLIGAYGPLPRLDNPNLIDNRPLMHGGSTWINGNLVVHGQMSVTVVPQLGEGLFVAGTIQGVDDSAVLSIGRSRFAPTGWETASAGLTTEMNSRSPDFTTFDGAIRDGIAAPDRNGQPRGVGRKEPPRLFDADPNTGMTRYDRLTRLSGRGEAGEYGHGRGVYVNNSSDRQIRAGRSERIRVGSEESMIYDWLNPNNGQADSGWQGNYYVPRGAFLLLMSNGFVITRDARGPEEERSWRTPTGEDTGLQAIRFRIGEVNGRRYIINTLTPGVDIDSASPDYSRGEPFNGVLLFEGNVRVRGVIPTDVQLTVVSKATIYVEGSIVAGVTDAGGGRLNRPSRSTVALLARDYVALNTTQFFAPLYGSSLRPKQEFDNPTGYNPLELAVGQTATFGTEFVLDPASGNVPSNWQMFAQGYRTRNGTGLPLNPALLLSHAADDGGPTYLSMDVNLGTATSTYRFYQHRYLGQVAGTADGVFAFTDPGTVTFTPNYAHNLLGGDNRIAVYGLGLPATQVYPRFETIGFPILPQGPTPQEDYRLRPQETNLLNLRVNPIGADPVKDYLIARAAIVPHDVRIEAALYAEEGSFFVIPGNWFNPNPNDRRELYDEGTTEESRILARLRRYENFGTLPEAPFYGEPLAVRVNIVGSLAENMPASMSHQAQWLQKWGWIPNELGGSGLTIPQSFVPIHFATHNYVPNLTISHDARFATGRVSGYAGFSPANPPIRTDEYGRTLPPMPALPVSPTLVYFGEVTR